MLQALRPYRGEWGLECFGWYILGLPVYSFDALVGDALVGAHSYGRIELYFGWYFGGRGINPLRSFWIRSRAATSMSR